MRLFSMVSVLLILATAVLILFPGESIAQCCEPDDTESCSENQEEDDTAVVDEVPPEIELPGCTGGECCMPMPPPCPVDEEAESKTGKEAPLDEGKSRPSTPEDI